MPPQCSTSNQVVWPDVLRFGLSFVGGFAVLLLLHWIVRGIIYLFRRKGGTLQDHAQMKHFQIGPMFAAVEQFLFYIAAIAGANVFGFAVAGWLVLKCVSQYQRWTPIPVGPVPLIVLPGDSPMDPAHWTAALARIRFMIFVIGTGMSLAAGGLAGAVYHFMLRLLP